MEGYRGRKIRPELAVLWRSTRFVSLPPRISFALTTLSTKLLFKGEVYTLGDGRFIPVETPQAYHPVMVIEQGPKIRRIIRTEDYAKNVIDPVTLS